MSNISLIFISLLFGSAVGFTLPTGGNSWSLDSGQISNDGYSFTKVPAKFNTYFYTSSVKSFQLSITLTTSIKSKISVTVGSTTKSVTTTGPVSSNSVAIGTFKSTKGYNKITTSISAAKGSSKIGEGSVASFTVDGVLEGLTYVVDNSGSYFYWGRRGPSCHLSINTELAQVSYYYSQITVPVGFDHIGSYFMANGFSQGYFGIQVNSATERRVLFSVWSGYDTNNPAQIPTEYTVKLDEKGPEVVTGEFGGEGSGGQSYLIYKWKAGNTYSFLTRAEPQVADETKYTSWFKDPKNKTNSGWRLIAQWTRPKIQTYLTGIYSFLENFMPEKGNLTRMGVYGNQWYYDSSHTWKEALSMGYTRDATANDNQRRDADGGLYTGKTSFFLKMGGFFNSNTAQGTPFTRKAKKIAPIINFDTLPK